MTDDIRGKLKELELYYVGERVCVGIAAALRGKQEGSIDGRQVKEEGGGYEVVYTDNDRMYNVELLAKRWKITRALAQIWPPNVSASAKLVDSNSDDFGDRTTQCAVTLETGNTHALKIITTL